MVPFGLPMLMEHLGLQELMELLERLGHLGLLELMEHLGRQE
jgi:hypothetical protein